MIWFSKAKGKSRCQ